jgi:hypothetical protein
MVRRHVFYGVLALAMLALASVSCALVAEAPGEPAPAKSPAPTSQEEPVPTFDESVLTPLPSPTPVGPAPTPEPTPVVEERVVEVEWPAAMRVGDNDLIRLSLIPAPGGGYVPTPEVGGHEVEATAMPILVARPGYTGYARATLSASGLNAEPAGPEEQLLTPGQANTWRWTISPDEAGTYRAVISLSVRWQPEAGAGLPGPFEEAVWDRVLTIEARGTLGLSGAQADLVGAGGSVLGLVTGIPFAEKGLGILWKRLKQWRGKPRKAGRSDTGKKA